MQRKLLKGLAVAAAVALALTGCASGSSAPGKSESKGAVALSFGGLDITLWNDIIKIVKKQVEAEGYELLVDDPQWDVQKQVSDWDAWATRGVKALVAFPVQADAVVPATARLTSAGIPVMGYTTKWEGVEHAMVVKSFDDGKATGVEAGKWILETYGDKAITVALHTQRDNDLGIQRADGILAGLKETAPNAVVDELAGFSREEGQANTERQLTAKPDTKVWLSTSEENLLGTYRVLMNNGVDPEDPSIMLGSMDVTNESIDIIMEGKGNSILRLAYVFAAQPLSDAITELLIGAAEGKELKDVVVLPVRVTDENAMDYYIK